MILTPIIKAVGGFLLTFALAPECHAQANNWYQQYAPSYYYYQPNQANQYSTYYSAPSPAPGQTHARMPKQKAEKAGKRKQEPKDAQNNDHWMTDWNEAWAKALRQGRPLVSVFVHHGCPECDKLDSTLSRQDAWRTLENAVKVRVEFTKNAEIVHRFGVKLTPTFLVCSPAHNGEVYREVGALSLERLQTLKPSIDSLVTGPRAELPIKKRQKANLSTSQDDQTSRSVASL